MLSVNCYIIKVFLTSILAVASAQIFHTCFQRGTQPASDCAQFVDDFCNDVTQNTVSQRCPMKEMVVDWLIHNAQFRIGDSGARCYNSSKGKKCMS